MARKQRVLTFGLTLCLVINVCLASGTTPFMPIEVSEHAHDETTQGNITIRSTSGESGVRCTKINRHCLTDIECVNKKCVCPPGTKGNGEFECIDENNFLCVVTADPHLTGYQQAHADVDLPCRYRLTRFVTDHRSKATPHAFCSVEVYATNELNMGFYYVRSLHISLGITDSGQQVHDQFEVKKFGVTDDQIFKFLSNVTKTRTLWGFSVHETINGVDVFPTYDEHNNFAVLWVPQCATRIKYRAYDRSVHRQPLLPGISIMAPYDFKFVDGYGEYPHSLCGTNNDSRTLYVDRGHELGLHNHHLAIIYDILNEKAPQHGNPKRAECEAAMEAFENSQNKAADVNYCGPILTNAQTRKCIVAAGPQPIEAFTACLNLRQLGDVDDCNYLKDLRDDCGPRWKGPALDC